MEAITLSIAGAERFASDMEAARGRAEDLRPVFEYGHALWLEEIRHQFETQGRFFHGGEQWAPLNPDYAERKLRLYGPPPGTLGILYATGRMYEAFTQEGHAEHVKIITEDAAAFGASVEYAKYHQAGTDKMPKRDIIKARNRFKRNLLRASILWITKGALPNVGATEE